MVKRLYRKLIMSLWLNCFGKELDDMLFRYPKIEAKFGKFFKRLIE